MASKYTNDRDYELKVVQALCWARAFETETVFIHTNPGGSRDEGFMGGSGVWAPLRGKVGGFDGEEVGLRIVDVDLGVLKVSSDFMVLWPKEEAVQHADLGRTDVTRTRSVKMPMPEATMHDCEHDFYAYAPPVCSSLNRHCSQRDLFRGGEQLNENSSFEPRVSLSPMQLIETPNH